MASLLVDSEKCIKCGICAAECPILIIDIEENKTLPFWVDGAGAICINCGHCVAVCPAGALELNTMPLDKCVPIENNLKTTPEQIEQFLKSRRSIRAYKDEPVERQKLAKLIDIARYAPSGHNKQPVHWLVVENKEDVKQIAGLTINWLRELPQKDPRLATLLHAQALITRWDSGIDMIARGAPHLVIAHAPKGSTSMSDCCIALAYLELAAYSMDVGACWAGYIQAGAAYYPPLTQALNFPEGHVSFGVLMAGYPKYTFSHIPARNVARVTWR